VLTPAREVPLPTAPELARLLAKVAGDRWEVVLGVLAYTCMRRGEVLRLSWSVVDLDAGTVHVERDLVRLGTDLVIGETKTAK
jgi:integrase